MNGRKFSELDKEQREILSEAWTWLQDNGYPYDVTEDSRYLFLYRVSDTLYSFHKENGHALVCVVEVRPYQKAGSDRFELWLQVLFVREQYRRTGIGEFMLEGLLRSSRDNSLEVSLGTKASNTAMIQLAEKLKFKRSETVVFSRSCLGS